MDPLALTSDESDDPSEENQPSTSECICKRCGDTDGVGQVPSSLSMLLELKKEDLICSTCKEQSFEYIHSLIKFLKVDIDNSSNGIGTGIPEYLNKELLQLLVPSIRVIISQNGDIKKGCDDYINLKKEIVFIREQLAALNEEVDKVNADHEQILALVEEMPKIPTYQTKSVSPLDISPYESEIEDTDAVHRPHRRSVEHKDKSTQIRTKTKSKETQADFMPQNAFNEEVDAFSDYNIFEDEEYVQIEKNKAKEKEAAKAKEKEKEAAKIKEKEKEPAKAKEKEKEAAKAKEKEKEAAKAKEKEKQTAKIKEKEKEAAKVKEKEKEAAKIKEKENETAKAKEKAIAKTKEKEKKVEPVCIPKNLVKRKMEKLVVDNKKCKKTENQPIVCVVLDSSSDDDEIQNHQNYQTSAAPINDVKETTKKEPSEKNEIPKFVSVSKKQGDKVIYSNTYLISIRKSPYNMPLPAVKQACYVKTEEQGKISWIPGKILKIDLSVENKYLVEINSSKATVDVTAKEIANFLNDAKKSVFNMGNRVITVHNLVGSLSGVIAEMPDIENKYRFLIFADDGTAIYEDFTRMRMIFEQTVQPHEYFPINYQKFVSQYFKNLPKKKVLDIKVSDHLRVKHKGRWVQARVVEVDNSIIKILYLENNKSNWIYKGSPDIYNILDDFLATKTTTDSESPRKSQDKRIKRSTCTLLVPASNSDSSDDENVKVIEVDDTKRPEPRAVAKKTTRSSTEEEPVEVDKRPSRRRNRVRNKNVQEIIPNFDRRPKAFKAHSCTKQCVKESTKMDSLISNHLVIPISLGFSREQSSATVIYKGPCGVTLTNCNEVLDYLKKTKVESLSIDMFDFSHDLNLFDELVINPKYQSERDITNGKELRPIPAVNEIDHDVPQFINYISNRVEFDTSFLPSDAGFLICCDCTDGCRDKSKCACWKLTINTAKDYDRSVTDIGYDNKRLYSNVLTGIYECNVTCKCNDKCLNRVAQLPLSAKLQLFKTEKTGWGTRTVHDIPKGTFVCLYAGQVIPDFVANEIGIEKGDDYLAELDFIDIMEDLKDLSDDGEKGAVSVRDLYKCKDKAFVLDGQAVGNIGKYLNHSCEPNLFVQNVFVDTPDLRFPWVAFFANKTIFAGSELTWDYGYTVNSIANRVLYCQCGSKKCRKRLI